MRRLRMLSAACLLGGVLAAAPAPAQTWGPQQERYVGQSAWDGLESEGRIFAVPPNDPMYTVFQRIVAQSTRQDLDYSLYYQRNDDEINAYALPDGRMVIATGLVHALPQGDRDAMAFVIAHEVAHLEKRHAERLGTQSGVTNLALGWLTGGQNNWVRLLGGVGSKLLTSGYSRGMEAEADREGLRLMDAAGYDPVGALRTLDLFRRLEAREGRSSVFPTHPTAADRYQDTQAYLHETGRI